MANLNNKATIIERNGNKELQLPNSTVILTPNPKAIRTFQGRTDHDGSFMYSNTSQSWTLPQLPNETVCTSWAAPTKLIL